MGMYMSFTRVTPEVLDQAFEDPKWARGYLDGDLDDDLDDSLDDDDDDDGDGDDDDGDPDDELYGDLDKAWDGIQFLLDRAGVPVELQMGGEYIGEDGELAGWAVDDVKDAARHLRATPFEQLARHFDPVLMMERCVYPPIWDRDPADDDVLDYLKQSYEVLVRFFDTAAASESAAIMRFG
jgi:Domain of unknown function (DUF1877)